MPLPKEGEVWQKDENAKMVVSKHNGNNLVVGEDMLLVEVRGVEPLSETILPPDLHA